MVFFVIIQLAAIPILVLSDRLIVIRGNPEQVHQEYQLDLPRPRKRTDLNFQRWKENSLQWFSNE
jgi:sulfonate transport system ATP-binding protein